MGMFASVKLHCSSRTSVLFIDTKIDYRNIQDQFFIYANQPDGIDEFFLSALTVLTGAWNFEFWVDCDLEYTRKVKGRVEDGEVALDFGALSAEDRNSRSQFSMDLLSPPLPKPELEAKAILEYRLTNFSWRKLLEPEDEYKKKTLSFPVRGNLSAVQFMALKAHWKERGFCFEQILPTNARNHKEF